MKVRYKISLISIIGIVTTLVSMLLLRLLFINYAENVENASVKQNFHRAMSIIIREKNALESTVMDWAYWDDTFNFLNETNSDYVDNNLQDSTLANLDLDYIGLFNLKGDTAFTKTIGIDEELEDSFQEELFKGLNKGANYEKLLSNPAPITGILMVSGQPMLISISPVTTSDRKTPNNGIIIFAKFINQKFLGYLEEVLMVNTKFTTPQDPEIIEALQEDQQRIPIDNTIMYIKKTTDSVKSYALVNNVFNNSQIFMVLNTHRPLYRDGLTIINYASIIFIAAFAVIVGLCLWGLEITLIRRIEKLNQFMNCVSSKKKISEIIFLPGDDEISSLAASANNMLKELDNYYEEIRVNEERFHLIMEATNDGYFDTDLLMNKFKINPEWLRYLGYADNSSLDYDQVIDITHPEDRDLFRAALTNCLKGHTEKLTLEYRVMKSSGEWIWIQVRGKTVEYDNFRNPRRLIGTISDITRRKNFERENLYLSQTDVVTTLKNRTFVEILLDKADKCDFCNSWIIMGDINGLRLFNDTFGDHEGDRLLRAIGETFWNCCSSDDIPARWSGDEFLIFLKDKPAEYVDDLIGKIKKACENITGFQAPISISWGRARKDKFHPNMKAVIKLAEERMYRNKLLESRSTKSSLLSSLEQTLHEKHIETEEHTRRIAQICVHIGKKMGLTQEELDEAALLSLLHDIGKIGIPEAILLKPGNLTNDEWEVMKTHSEIGYRIAVSTPDFAHVAKEILSHHERYDGTGYPQGLKGKEIPKLSRLLTIVDSFDVMTHARHYKEAMTTESAIQEIKSCAGKQFDPDMVEQFLVIIREDDFLAEIGIN